MSPRTSPPCCRVIVLTFGLAGCGPGELPGDYFQVTVTGAENLCTGDGTDYTENYEYRVMVENTDLTLAIGEDVWATGTADGCHLDYTSLAWSTYREDLEIQWQINGDAMVNLGGGAGCAPQDWEGTETFVITESAHPAVKAGCTYTLDVVGKYLRTVGGEDPNEPPPLPPTAR